MKWLQRKVFSVDGFRFNIGDEVWFVHDDKIKSAAVLGRAWAEGTATPWWSEWRGATYFVRGEHKILALTNGVFASKEKLLASL